MTSVEPGPQGRWVGNTLAEFERDLADNLCYERGTTAESASAQDAYWTLAITIRDRLADRRARTARANYTANPKFVYYLSAEYMLGRQLRQNALYTGTAELARRAMAGSGFSAGELDDLDVEPGLGNGGLGRLAACLLDSLATLDVPAVGYGIRYEFGIFKQTFEDGYQVELPDDWTFYGNPWEFPAPDDLQVVGFYGHTEAVDDDQGGLRARWVPGQVVRGEPSHMLVPGYGTQTVNILRLWRARAGGESFDLGLFNAGRYAEAVEAQMSSENLTKVLYPSDSTEAGRELRLEAAVFPGLLLAAGHHPPVPVPQQRLGGVPGQGCHPAQRHPPGAGDTRAHAPAGRRERGRLGAGLVHHPPHLRLHLPYFAARGAGDLAGPDVRAAAAPPPGDHPRPQSLLPAGRARTVSGRRRARRPDVADPRGPRAPGADGKPGRGRQLRGQRRGRAAVTAAGPDDIARLRGPMAGQVPKCHERRQPAPVPPAGQPAPVRPDHGPAGRRPVADRPGAAAEARGLRR